jgi:hypothetical protein
VVRIGCKPICYVLKLIEAGISDMDADFAFWEVPIHHSLPDLKLAIKFLAIFCAQLVILPGNG